MPMKSKTEAKNTSKKKTTTKTATTPKALPAGLHQKQGIWVFGVGEPIPAGATDEVLRTIRRERELSFMGNLPARRPRGTKSR
jgi:hypothetical protein